MFAAHSGQTIRPTLYIGWPVQVRRLFIHCTDNNNGSGTVGWQWITVIHQEEKMKHLLVRECIQCVCHHQKASIWIAYKFLLKIIALTNLNFVYKWSEVRGLYYFVVAVSQQQPMKHSYRRSTQSTKTTSTMKFLTRESLPSSLDTMLAKWSTR